MAAILRDLTRNFYAYKSDDTNIYQVGGTNQNYNIVNGADPVQAGVNPVLPRGWVVRRLYGKEEAGTRTRVPILQNDSDLWLGTTTTFTKDNTDYTVEGKDGEKRTNKS
jgi:hypothetical protein